MQVLGSYRKVLVSVGHDSHPMLSILDVLRWPLFSDALITLQSGYMDVESISEVYFERVIDFVQGSAWKDLIASNDLIVCHCGGGIIRDVLEAKKVSIVVPRLRRLGEHINDHQGELFRFVVGKELCLPGDSGPID